MIRQKTIEQLAASLRDGHAATLAVTPPETHAQLVRIYAATVAEIGRTLSRQNPGFTPSRWLSACGLPAGNIR